MLRSTTAADARIDLALDLMATFADRTGLTSGRPPRRYLWTDAFAVCNFLALDRLDLARRLVDQVHAVLGRHRPDDSRRGWISGLDDEEGARHPTSGGLRIGKPLLERDENDRFDEQLEWERDGQYFHYLTKWIHALDQLARRTGDIAYSRWAVELAEVSHRAFVRPSPAGERPSMAWKMSVDLSRPVVPSMGHHDPLDGYLTCLELSATASQMSPGAAPTLRAEAADYRAMIPASLATPDPLGTGGLLVDASRAEQLARQGAEIEANLAPRLYRDGIAGALAFEEGGDLSRPATARLAFRELGLAIGIAASSRLDADPTFASVRDGIERFWLRPDARATDTWLEHQDINEVMLATALAPDGFVTLHGLAPG